MAKKNKAKKRLAQWDHRLWEDRAWLFSTVEEFDDWCRTARATDVCGKALSKAAKFFHLDEKRPAHQRLLLFILADVLFGETRRTGRPNKWRHRTYELLYDRAQVTNGDGEIGDRAAAKEMKKHFPERYGRDDTEILRKQLCAARQKFEREPEVLRKKLWADYKRLRDERKPILPVQ